MRFIQIFSSFALIQVVHFCTSAHFPPKSYSILFPSQPQNVSTALLSNVPFSKETTEFTLSVWIYQLGKAGLKTYFSFAVPAMDNVIVFGPENNGWHLNIFNIQVNFNHPVRLNEWVHYVLTWQSVNGSVTFYVNGKLVHSSIYPSMVGKKWLDGEETLVLGQEQDSVGGKFDSSQSFQGEMTEVNVWDFALDKKQVEKVYHSQLEGNIVSWSKSVWKLINISVGASTVHGLCQDSKPTTDVDGSDTAAKEYIFSPPEEKTIEL